MNHGFGLGFLGSRRDKGWGLRFLGFGASGLGGFGIGV